MQAGRAWRQKSEDKQLPAQEQPLHPHRGLVANGQTPRGGSSGHHQLRASQWDHDIDAAGYVVERRRHQ